MRIILAALVLLSSTTASAQTVPVVLDNKASDPRAMRWMQGVPVPDDKLIRFQDGNHWAFPRLRWSFSNMQTIMPTVPVKRSGPVRTIPYALRKDIDAISFMPLGGTKPMTWRESLDANYTDGLVVMHKGRIIYDYSFGAYDMTKVHALMSVTKSFVGLLATQMIHEGKIDPKAQVTQYLPELENSGFAGATVQQVLDMTTALDFVENYANPNPTLGMFFTASGFMHPPGYSGPKTNFAALKALTRKGDHGALFSYRSPHTDVLGYIIARVGGKPLHQQLEDRYWSKLGMEADANMFTDGTGTGIAAGGLSVQLRDLARFGEMLRNNGKVGARQIVSAKVIADIKVGADREKFKSDGYKTLPGWSYRNQFWISHDDHGMYMARGIHGQMLYVNPKAELVIARFASHPVARNPGIDPTSLPAWRALAEHLIAKP